MRIRVPGSTSATKSLSSPVSVILSWSESNGVKLSLTFQNQLTKGYHDTDVITCKLKAHCHHRISYRHTNFISQVHSKNVLTSVEVSFHLTGS